MERDLDHIIGGYIRGNLSAADARWLEEAMAQDAALAAEVQGLQDTVLLEHYLKGELTDPERITFEKRLQNDPALQQQLKKQEKALQLLHLYKRQQIADVLDDIAQQKPQKKGKSKGRSWLPGLLIIFLGIFLVFYYINPFSTNNKSNDFQEPSTGSSLPTETERTDLPPQDTISSIRENPNNSSKSSDSQPDNNSFRRDSQIIAYMDRASSIKLDLSDETVRGNSYEQWLDFYSKNEYQNVITLLQPMVDSLYRTDPTAALGLGLTYFYQNNYQKAIQIFNPLIENNTNQKSNARWYKSLALYHLNRRDEWRTILQEIAALRADTRKKEAIELLRLLESK